MHYYIKAFKNYTKCNGRASRKEYWMFVLFWYIFYFILDVIQAVLGLNIPYVDTSYGYLTLVYSIISCTPFFSVSVRRLHDVGKSEWYTFLSLLPVINFILLYFYLKPGDPGDNKYGAPPDNTQEYAARTNTVVSVQFEDAEPYTKTDAIRYCSQCGFELFEDSVFCSKCGAAIKREKAVEPEPAYTHSESSNVECENISDSEKSAQCDNQTQEQSKYSLKDKDQLDEFVKKYGPFPTGEKPSRRIHMPTKLSEKKVEQAYDASANIENVPKRKKFKFKTRHVVCTVLVVVIAYIGINYLGAVISMNSQKFTMSKRFYDNLLVSETLFSTEYEYVSAGALMEDGEYAEALNKFKSLTGIDVPEEIIESLKESVYADGQLAYRFGDMSEAKKNFGALAGYAGSTLSGYKRSDDYLVLIKFREMYTDFNFYVSVVKRHYNEIAGLIGFEDANKIIIETRALAERFLEGRWENKSYRFQLTTNDDGGYTAEYNLPHKNVDGYFYLDEGIFFLETDDGDVKLFRFEIIDADTISVYCYKDGSTHTLYRQ